MAPKGNKNALGGRGGVGGPQIYKPEFAKEAIQLCMQGATDAELADHFEVAIRTIRLWKVKYPEFNASLKGSKLATDERVERSLYERALGYSYDALKIVVEPKTGNTTEVPYREHVPPDPTSMIFWLKNRQPERWRDAHVIKNESLDPEAIKELVLKDIDALGLTLVLPPAKVESKRTKKRGEGDDES